MSLRLKNESSTFPPGGLQFHERQLGWYNVKNDPNTIWSWDGLVNAVYNLRRANAARFPKLSTDRAVIRRQISEQNANRIASMPGAETYLSSAPIAQGGQAPNPPVPHAVNWHPNAAVAKVDKLARGAASLLDWWIRQEGKPVSHELAEQRAAICATCPKNNSEGVESWFTKSASEFIRKKMEVRKGLSVTTSSDDKISVCEVCLCPLKLAVHAPIEIKAKRMTKTEFGELPDHCWIWKEVNASGCVPKE